MRRNEVFQMRLPVMLVCLLHTNSGVRGTTGTDQRDACNTGKENSEQ
jgi:hypothetical protein